MEEDEGEKGGTVVVALLLARGRKVLELGEVGS